MKHTDQPIVVEQVFDKPVDQVWKAITHHDVMVQWFFDNIPEFKPQVGFKTQFNVKAPSRDFLHLWEVTEVIPNKKIVTNWQYEGCSGESLVSFELFEQGQKTKLMVSTKVLDDFDDSIPEFRRESCQMGWNYFINERLSSFLNN